MSFFRLAFARSPVVRSPVRDVRVRDVPRVRPHGGSTRGTAEGDRSRVGRPRPRGETNASSARQSDDERSTTRDRVRGDAETIAPRARDGARARAREGWRRRARGRRSERARCERSRGRREDRGPARGRWIDGDALNRRMECVYDEMRARRSELGRAWFERTPRGVEANSRVETPALGSSVIGITLRAKSC